MATRFIMNCEFMLNVKEVGGRPLRPEAGRWEGGRVGGGGGGGRGGRGGGRVGGTEEVVSLCPPLPPLHTYILPSTNATRVRTHPSSRLRPLSGQPVLRHWSPADLLLDSPLLLAAGAVDPGGHDRPLPGLRVLCGEHQCLSARGQPCHR